MRNTNLYHSEPQDIKLKWENCKLVIVILLCISNHFMPARIRPLKVNFTLLKRFFDWVKVCV